MSRSWQIPVLVGIAGLSFWLLLAGPANVLGVDGGNVGVMLLVATLWGSLWFVSTRSEQELSASASPGEWQAWLGLGFLVLVTVYFALKLPLFAVTGTAMDNPHLARVGRNVVMLLIAWAILSTVMRSRWQSVRNDERDRQIADRGEIAARYALAIQIVVLAVLLGFTPADRLQWATPLMLANMLILTLMVSNLVETAVQAVSYWRDRH